MRKRPRMATSVPSVLSVAPLTGFPDGSAKNAAGDSVRGLPATVLPGAGDVGVAG